MKMIEITTENFPWIASRVKKFFNGRSVIYWHNYDCGNRHHIQRDFIMKNEYGKNTRVDPMDLWLNPLCEIVTPTEDSLYNRSFIRLKFVMGYGGVINIGDTIGFAGNRLHVKSKAVLMDYKYLYEVFQIWDPNGGFKDVHPTPPDYGEYNDDYDYDGFPY